MNPQDKILLMMSLCRSRESTMDLKSILAFRKWERRTGHANYIINWNDWDSHRHIQV